MSEWPDKLESKQNVSCETSGLLRTGAEAFAEAEKASVPDTNQRKQDALNRIIVAHEAWFDVQRDYEYAGEAFAGYAEFHSQAEKYVLVKRAKLWGASAHEYLFFQLADHFDEAALSKAVQFMKTEALKKVHPDSEHMTSYLSLVVLASSVGDALPKQIRKTSFRKNFKLGFEGWADLRLAVIDFSTASIYTNAMGKELRATLEANAFGDQR